MVLLLIILIVTSILTMNRVEYVDTDGGRSSGAAAARKLRAEQNQWTGYLTEDVFTDIILENSKLTVPQKHFLKISWSRIRSMPGNRESQISAT